MDPGGGPVTPEYQMALPRISVAIGSYDRHAPLLERAVAHPEFAFEFVEADQSGVQGRHERFLHAAAWDAAELSLSSYLVAIDQGLPVGAVPIFPRRLFSQSQLYKNVDAGINGPADLAGKRVGLNSFQTTLSVLAKGDLAHYYGVPWKDITYVTSRGEAVAVEPPAGVTIERVATRQQLEEELVAGSIHALFSPSPPRPFLDGHPKVAHLFSDPAAEEERHLAVTGYFPIMHVIAYRKESAARYPALPCALFTVFEQARELARRRWNDPNWSLLMWGAREMARQGQLTARDPWTNGLDANRKNIEDFTQYSLEQGLIRRRPSPSELFAPGE